MKPKPSLRGLEKKIGYVFSDEALLLVALTHKSYSRDNNERLEFIGDAVLGYVIATDLFELHPKVQEDALSLMRVALVRGNILAEVAEEIGLSEYLRLGTGELKSGGRQRPSILADGLEAIIGAVHEDGGIESCRALIRKLLASRLSKLDVNELKDPKTRLQEILQAKSEALPVYEVESVEGEDHDLLFEVKCSLPSLNLSEVAIGSSRRLSEKSAAQKVITQLEAMGFG